MGISRSGSSACAFACAGSAGGFLYDPTILVEHFTEPRIGEQQRAVRDAYALERDAHNELFELVRWLPRWQWPIAAANALLVGSRAEPGLVAGAWLASPRHAAGAGARGGARVHARTARRAASAAAERPIAVLGRGHTCRASRPVPRMSTARRRAA